MLLHPATCTNLQGSCLLGRSTLPVRALSRFLIRWVRVKLRPWHQAETPPPLCAPTWFHSNSVLQVLPSGQDLPWVQVHQVLTLQNYTSSRGYRCRCLARSRSKGIACSIDVCFHSQAFFPLFSLDLPAPRCSRFPRKGQPCDGHFL